MIKLEEKLKLEELGYHQAYGPCWIKLCGKASILLTEGRTKIVEGKIIKESCLTHLDIEQASKEMQKDLEILKGVENE